MLRVRDTLVDVGMCEVQFACDLGACRGACCTMPGPRGAPLRDAEIENIHLWYPQIEHLLPEKHRIIIDERGPYQGTPGDFTTTCVDNRACVFVFFDRGIAKCAFEHAHMSGEIPWRKPISCHLFPVRVRYGGLSELRFEYISECRSALDRGCVQGTYLSDFLRSSLTRAFGEEWYDVFQRACREHRESRSA